MLGHVLSPLARSFRAKLATALLATVGLLLGATLVAIQWVTADQVEAAVERASVQAHAAFLEWEALRVNELERLGRPFTGSIRAAVLLGEASRGGELEPLAREASYELQRAQIDTSLVTFADGSGEPLFTLRNGQRSNRRDPADVSSLVTRLLSGTEERLHGYRSVGQRLFIVQAEPVFLGSDLVGTVVFGSPVTDADARRLGDVVGAEVCLIVGGRCAAGTPGASGALRRALMEPEGPGRETTASIEGESWRVLAEVLVEGHPEEGLRAIALPLGPVRSPFQRILTVLLLAGVVALGVAVILSLRLSRGLTEPVRALVAAARRVGRGEYGTTVEIDSTDEMGTLATAFNDMTAGLRLKEKYRGVLDKVVSPEVAEELLSGEIELGGEAREATVLFADLRGFTGMTEHMPPEHVIGLLNGCMERLTEAVESEGGVVDKYVGDELMAIFGAPVSRGDDAMRACRAAERMVRSMETLNRERGTRGEEAIGVGIGIGSGPVVAGNMGTPSRLNYTVLGATVNLAARLCSLARASQVFLSEGTLRAVEGRVAVRALPPVELKGFSRPMEVFQMTGSGEPETASRSGAAGGGRGRGSQGGPAGGGLARSGLLLAGLLAASLLPGGPTATGTAALPAQQADGLPTLRGLGLAYLSPSGLVQLDFSGRLDLEYYLPSDEPSWIIPSTDPFFAPRARVFADLFVGSRIQATAELRADRGEEPAADDYEARLDQAYVSVQPLEDLDLHLQAGKFASPFGGYPARHHTVQDPFIRPPLAYDWRTTIPTDRALASLDELVALGAPVNGARATGAPIIWGVPYQWGLQVVGGVGELSFRGGTVNSAPAGAPETWALDSGAGVASTWVAGVGYQVSAGLYLDASWSRGPYLSEKVEGVEEGKAFDDYDQSIFGIEAVYARGPVILRGEFFDDTWEVPNLDYDPRDRSWYVEGQADLFPGLYAALRYGRTSFRPIEEGSGSGSGGYGDGQGWDWGVRRIQIASGYRLAHNVGIQVEYTKNQTLGAQGEPDDDLTAIQLWWRY